MNNVQGIFELAWKALVSGITSNTYFHVGYDLILQVLQHLWLRRQAAPSGRLSWWCIFIHHNTVLHPESLTVRQTNINMSTNQSPLTFPSQYHCQFLFTSYGIRSSLGEYHKDSRNLKRLKDSSEFVHEVAEIFGPLAIIFSPSLNFPSFSYSVPASEAHAAKCCGVSQRVAQNSAWHRLLHRWCEHLHSESMFIS